MTATVQPAPTSSPNLEAPEPPRPPRRAGRLGPAASTFGWALLGAAVFVAVWALVCTRTKDLPTPSAAFSTLRLLLDHAFQAKAPYGRGIGLQLLSSLGRVFKGFLLACVVGVPLGMAMGSSTRTWKAMNPIVQLLRPVSPLAWFPIALTITKSAPKASVWVIFVTALWLVVINTAAAAAQVPHEQLEVSRVFHFGRPAYVRHVLVPNALPGIVTGLRSAMGIAWMVIVAVEMMSASSGIGFFVWDSYNAGKLDQVIAAIVLIGIVGLVLDTLFMQLSRKVTLEVRR
jgi:nitrate/nitrite transport system permease protein